MNEWERSLLSLPAFEPDARRQARLREQCHAALGRTPRRRIESAVVIGASGAYLAGVIWTALLLSGF